MTKAFDPKAYLAQKAAEVPQAPAFDPQAYLAEKAQAAAPQVGGVETFFDNVNDATPGMRTASNVLAALGLSAFGPKAGARLTPQAAAELGMPQEQPRPGLVDNYRTIRDTHAARTEAGNQQNEGAALGGKLVGTALSLGAPLPKVSVGTGAAGRIASNALTGGAYGAANAVLNGKADLTRGEVGQLAKDVVGVNALRKAGKDWSEGKKLAAVLDVMGAGATGGLVTGGTLGGVVEGARAVGVGELLKKVATSQNQVLVQKGAAT